jgi:hypothetical protein
MQVSTSIGFCRPEAVVAFVDMAPPNRLLVDTNAGRLSGDQIVKWRTRVWPEAGAHGWQLSVNRKICNAEVP